MEKFTTKSPNKTFDPLMMGDDITEVVNIYTDFFAEISNITWDAPSSRGAEEWTLHETIAHLCALNGAGLESIRHGLAGKSYTFEGLSDRYAFNDYNRQGIDANLGLSREALFAKFLEIHQEAADIAGDLTPKQAETEMSMPIYNRPVQIIEALGIIFIHAGIFHAAQVAEPAEVAPLWTRLSPEVRQRGIGRVMRALSLLYRYDLAGDLRATFQFEVEGSGGGKWHVQVAPGTTSSGVGPVENPDLIIRLRDTGIFCRMFTGRMNLLLFLLTGKIKLRGNLRLFLRFGSLFSVDARK
jgi:hypothetical protein